MFVLFAGDGVELDFAGFAVAGFDGVYDSAADFGGDGEAIDEDEDGLGEVEFEEGLGGGELDDAAVLEEAVIAASAEFGEALFQGVGDIDYGRGWCGLRGFFRGAVHQYGWRGGFDDGDA